MGTIGFRERHCFPETSSWIPTAGTEPRPRKDGSVITQRRHRASRRACARTWLRSGPCGLPGGVVARLTRDPIVDDEEIFEQFEARAIIMGRRERIKSGKEAVVYRCDAHPATGLSHVAVKVYKDVQTRSFRHMNTYLDGRIGRTIRKRRDILHMLANADERQHFWVSTELGALETLYAAGLPVPRPLGSAGTAIAMEFVAHNDDDEPAPRLRDLRPDPDLAQALERDAVALIENMLAHDIIHGDLSPYNLLVRNGRLMVIDFPQAADARYSTQAQFFLARDTANVLSYFRELGTGPDAARQPADELAAGLWARWESGDLYLARDAAAVARAWGL